MGEPVTGSCLCGAVTYAVNQPLGGIIACHCTDCQKAAGAGASHNAVAKAVNVQVTGGEPKTTPRLSTAGAR